MADNRPQVSVVRATSLPSDLERCLALLGGAARFAKRGDRVLIKPNFGVPRPPESAVITDPELVFALADLFLANGARVTIGESCVTGFELAKVFEALDVPARAAKRGIALVDLRRDRWVELAIPDSLVLTSVRVARSALEADLIVNVPKMKTHVETTVTLALKNIKGLLVGNEKARLHQLDAPVPDLNALEAAVADLNAVIPPTLNVIDGIVAMEGGGPMEGQPVAMGVLVAGDNRVAVDVVACDLMGIDPATVQHLSLAAKRGLGPATPAEVEVLGDDLAGLRRPFRRPDWLDFALPAVELLEAGACSGCAGGIRQALRGMRDHPAVLSAERMVRVHVGAKVEGPAVADDLVVGNCAIRRLRAGRPVPGCPPLFGKMRLEMLRALTGEENAQSVQDGDRQL